MTITRTIAVGFLTALVLRHTTNLSWKIYESIEILDSNGLLRKFSLYFLNLNETHSKQLYVYISILIGSLFFLFFLLPYIFNHDLKNPACYIILLCLPSFVIFLLHKNYLSSIFIAAVVSTIVVKIWIIIKLHRSVGPINVYYQWRKVDRKHWRHLLWVLILSPVFVGCLYWSPGKLESTFTQNYPSLLFIVFIFTFVFFVPFLEEIVFRKFFFQSLYNQNGLLKSALISSVAFSIYHLDPIRLVPTFILGMALFLIFRRTQSLIICTSVHGITNIINVFLVDFIVG